MRLASYLSVAGGLVQNSSDPAAPRARRVARLVCGVWAVIWATTAFSSKAEVLYLPMNALELAHQRAAKIACADHLKQIVLAAHAWSMDNADQPPPDLQALRFDFLSPEVMFCPANALISAPTNWAEIDWSQVDYGLLASSNWANPKNPVIQCRIHTSVALSEGTVLVSDIRPGWPRITAAPVEALTTPNETVSFAVRGDTQALQPVQYQWRREQLSYVTNVVRVSNPDDPRGIYWQTNVIPKFTATALARQTNATLWLTNVQTNDSGYYSVALTNDLGAMVSRPVGLRVEPELAGVSTNESWSQAYCLNNLRMIGLARGLWAVDHNGQPPSNLAVLTNADGSPMLGWPAALFCRSDTNRSPPAAWANIDYANISYELVSSDLQDPYAPFCRCRVHGYYVQMDGEAIQQPRFGVIRRLPDGRFEVNFRVFAGRTNVLEVSNDLSHWTSVQTYSQTDGDLQYLEVQPAVCRFYRLRLP